MTEAFIIQKPVYWFAETVIISMDWFLYDNGLRHERFNINPNTEIA